MKAKSMHTQNSVITTQLTEDHEPKYVYFIDGVYYQQKGFKSDAEAIKAGKAKLFELNDEITPEEEAEEERQRIEFEKTLED